MLLSESRDFLTQYNMSKINPASNTIPPNTKAIKRPIGIPGGGTFHHRVEIFFFFFFFLSIPFTYHGGSQNRQICARKLGFWRCAVGQSRLELVEARIDSRCIWAADEKRGNHRALASRFKNNIVSRDNSRSNNIPQVLESRHHPDTIKSSKIQVELKLIKDSIGA